MVDVVIGARFDSFDIDVLNVPAAETRTRKDEKVSPRLGLIFKPQENISLYGTYSESFLPRSGEQFANINGDNNQLDPDEFANLEAGVKWDFTPGLSLTAAVFEIEQSSPQVADGDPETLDVIESETQGAEIQLQGRITERLFISAAIATWMARSSAGPGPPGARLGSFRRPWPRSGARSTSPTSSAWASASPIRDESFINNSNTATLPAYARLDAAAFYDLRDTLRVQLNVENLTDTLYFPNAHSTHQATVGAPLNAKLTISGRF